MANPFTKAKLTTAKGRQDAFERNHEQGLTMQGYTREYNIAKYSIEQGTQSLSKYIEGPIPVEKEQLQKKIDDANLIVANTPRVQKAYTGMLSKFEKLRNKEKEEDVKKRNNYAATVTKVFPALKDQLTQIQTVVDGELKERRKEVKDLQQENTKLKTDAASSSATKSVVDQMQDIFGFKVSNEEVRRQLNSLKEQREEEIQRCGEAEEDYLMDVDDREDEKDVLAGVISRLEREVERQEGFVEAEKQNVQAERHKRETKVNQLDDKISKLEKRLQNQTFNFEWVQGRWLENHGLAYTSAKSSIGFRQQRDAALTQVNEANSELEILQQACAQVEQSNTELAGRNGTLTSDLDTARSEKETAVNKLGEDQGSWDRTREGLETVAREARELAEKRKEEIDELNRKLNEANLTIQKAQNSLRDERASRNSSEKAFKRDAAISEENNGGKDVEILILTQQLETSRKSRSTLQQQLSASQRTSKENLSAWDEEKKSRGLFETKLQKDLDSAKDRLVTERTAWSAVEKRLVQQLACENEAVGNKDMEVVILRQQLETSQKTSRIDKKASGKLLGESNRLLTKEQHTSVTLSRERDHLAREKVDWGLEETRLKGLVEAADQKTSEVNGLLVAERSTTTRLRRERDGLAQEKVNWGLEETHLNELVEAADTQASDSKGHLVAEQAITAGLRQEKVTWGVEHKRLKELILSEQDKTTKANYSLGEERILTESLRKKIDDLENSESRLERKIQEWQEYSKELRAKNKELDDISINNERVFNGLVDDWNKLEPAHNQLKEEHEKLKATYHDLESKKTRLAADKAALDVSVKNLTEDLRIANLGLGEHENTERDANNVKLEHVKLNKKIKKLEKDIAALPTLDMYNDLVSDNNGLKEEIDNLPTQGEKEDLERELETLKQQKGDLEQQIDTLPTQREWEDLERQCSQVKEQKTALQQQIDGLPTQDSYDELGRQLNDVKEQKEALQQQINGLPTQESHDDLGRQIKTLEAKKEALRLNAQGKVSQQMFDELEEKLRLSYQANTHLSNTTVVLDTHNSVKSQLADAVKAKGELKLKLDNSVTQETYDTLKGYHDKRIPAGVHTALEIEFQMFKEGHVDCSRVKEELDNLKMSMGSGAQSRSLGSQMGVPRLQSRASGTVGRSPVAPILTPSMATQPSPSSRSELVNQEPISSSSPNLPPASGARRPSVSNAPRTTLQSPRAETSTATSTITSKVTVSVASNAGATSVDATSLPTGAGLSNVGDSSSATPVNSGAPHNYTFLQSGELSSGVRTVNVDQSLIQKMDEQVARWTSQVMNWDVGYPNSHKKCVDSKLRKDGKNVHESSNPSTACSYCTRNHLLCVLIGGNGPVVVPLPEEERGSSLPGSADYYHTPDDGAAPKGRRAKKGKRKMA